MIVFDFNLDRVFMDDPFGSILKGCPMYEGRIIFAQLLDFVSRHEYEVPYLAHATMEPLNCLVDLRSDRCEIWTGTQFQTVATRCCA